MAEAHPERRASWSAIWPSVVIGGAILWASAGTEVDLPRLAAAGTRMADFLGRMVPPDLSVLPEVTD